MPTTDTTGPAGSQVPVINLAQAPGEHEAWDRRKSVIYLWAVVELVLVTNAWQISSTLRVKALRLFGASIGHDVVFRPRTRVKFPWKLHIGDRAWIGEGVWIHNQDKVFIGNDVVISQDSFITTGSHDHRRDMALVKSPVLIEDGAWITSRCIVLGGSRIGRSSLITPGTVAKGDVPENAIWGSSASHKIGERFPKYKPTL